MLQTIVFLMNTLMEYCSKTIFKSGRAEKLYMEIQKRLHLDQQNLKWEKSVHDILEGCGHDEYSIIGELYYHKIKNISHRCSKERNLSMDDKYLNLFSFGD